MKELHSKLIAGILTLSMCLMSTTVCSAKTLQTNSVSMTDAVETLGGITINTNQISSNNYKDTKYNNPISSEFFCADPTAVEYEGRLYVYGTNDHQQFEAAGPDVDNTYEKIKSLLIFSTDDMVNWIYHGEINVGAVAPWIMNSWAPTITSRVEEDGLTHFYLYFSNNGTGVGVITATDPVGPWSDPLGKPLISSGTPGLKDCPNPFDPGVVIDEHGVGWLSFGAGKAANGSDFMPGSARIVKLGDDMVSFASDFAIIPAPYLFEASELNYINGTYVYTYNTDWNDHSVEWPYDCPVPSGCSMVYMTTKTPLDSNSWVMRGEYFQNPGTAGFDYSNNHTHLHKYKGAYYLFYHTMMLKRGMGIQGSYRSLGVDQIDVDESTVTFDKIGGTKKGPNAVVNVNPFTDQMAADLNGTADISFDTTDMHRPIVRSDGKGAWISVKDIQFTESNAADTPTESTEPTLTDVNTITYHITVKEVDKDTTISMYPSTANGDDCVGSTAITGPGMYTITCDIGGDAYLMNMGFFKASNDALITFVIDTMTVNDKYDFDISAELTNTREWADGLKNIWNGFTDGDTVYSGDFAEFRYDGAKDAIGFYAAPIVDQNDNNSAPPLTVPISFFASVKGKGRMEVRLDAPTGDLLTCIDFDTPNQFSTIYNQEVATIGGTHDLYFVFSDANIAFDGWMFAPAEIESPKMPGDVNTDGVVKIDDVVMLNRLLGEDSTLRITPQGIINAECDGVDGLSADDATTILKYLAKIIDSLSA